MLTDLEITPPRTFGVATYPAGATFGPRALRDFEFVWIIEGEAEYRWENQSVLAPPGAIVLCRPGRDFFRWDPARRTRHGYFHFDIAHSPPAWGALSAWPLVRAAGPGGDSDLLHPLFRHLLTWSGRTSDDRQIRLVLATLLATFLSGEFATGDVPRETLPAAVARALAFIHETMEARPDAPLGLGEIAASACVTREHLCRLFVRSTGRSPAETVRLARLDRAVQLLARSNYGIAEIATLCGFPNPFHFSRRFKEAFGRAPSALRRDLQAGQTMPTPRLVQRR